MAISTCILIYGSHQLCLHVFLILSRSKYTTAFISASGEHICVELEVELVEIPSLLCAARDIATAVAPFPKLKITPGEV